MSSKEGPFRVLSTCGSCDPNGLVSSASISPNLESAGSPPQPPPERRYDCNNYETCLDLAAALDWDSFSCAGCSGEVNECLLWRAHQAKKHDRMVGAICDHLPNLADHSPLVNKFDRAENMDVRVNPSLLPDDKKILAKG